MAGEAGTLRSTEFRREREAAWRELETLLAWAEKNGVRTLSAKDLARLPALHRTAASSLSVARAISLDKNLCDFLENLVARSAMCVYGNHSGLSGTLREFVFAFPLLVRRLWLQVAISAALLWGGVATGFLLCSEDPSLYDLLVPEGMAQGRDPSATREELREGLYTPEGAAEGLTTFASALFSNNARIGMLCFVLGFAAGVPVFVLLFYNGLLLGAMSSVFHARGLALDWWGWLMPHGVTELGAIILCGAAGLHIGQALVFPGRHTRLQGMARAGRRGAVVVAGCVGMLVLAALIEGYFRQLVHSLPLRYSLVALTGLAWLAYFCFVGKGRRAASSALVLESSPGEGAP